MITSIKRWLRARDVPDDAHAEAVKAAANQLNEAILDARAAGLQVDLHYGFSSGDMVVGITVRRKL